MTEHINPDLRTEDQLFSDALSHSTGEWAYYDALGELQSRASEGIFQRAARLAESVCARERELAADVLGGMHADSPPMQAQCMAIMRRMLAVEATPAVIRKLLCRISRRDPENMLSLAKQYANHQDAGVRWQAVGMAGATESADGMALLVVLSNDPIAHVCDWATFELGASYYLNLDTPDVVNALVARLDDSDFYTRNEALAGLAVRKDHRVIPAVERALKAEKVDVKAVEAARDIASPLLYEALLQLEERWGGDPNRLDEAIEACDPTRDRDGDGDV